ncbi:GtrA family protein [Corynebacterium timonense]|uniref:Putative flippase GtrA (Transmembrane translocase of bactoprenol-linked glucose) n=1 Tax=Corynebacterium timonense TaxID=441500 RepID=A0A1H1QFQ0_9CORY|nr:GtrA family protein [Corynebacterium timonense]SDS22391.1 Putative flippase GtrA (transmembrane translocase of bactoprenol-linked glucose) [Corynebacterium timonense]
MTPTRTTPPRMHGGSTALTMRLRAGLREFLRFGIVGGSGVVVNLVVFYVAKKLLENGFSTHEADVFFNLLGTRWNVRWYHVLATISFLTANLWNYQLNRSWTFRDVPKRAWLQGFVPFLAAGLGSFLISLAFLTLFMNPTSPIALPSEIFDDSTGFRTKSYWAQALATVIATPANFIINKFWAFGKPKVAPLHRVV